MGFRQKQDELKTERWLEVDASMTGTLTFKDPVNLRINGRFEGALETKGVLFLGEKAYVQATITGESLTIGGTLKGEIVASSRIEMLSTAHVSGKISSPRIIMHDGAVLQGTVEMQPERNSGWMSPEELARYLEVDVSTVIEWAQQGRLPAQKQDNQWRFERAKIEQWLAQEKIKST